MSHGSFSTPSFPLSTRLLAAERILKARPLKSWLLWLSTLAEVFSFTTLLLVHLFCSGYFSVALVAVVYILGSVRAWSLLDVIQSPVHLLRPSNHSKLGLGSRHKPAGCFYLVSAAIQVGCATYISMNLWSLWPVILNEQAAQQFDSCHFRQVYHESGHTSTDYGYFSSGIPEAELDEALQVCESENSTGHWCGVASDISVRCQLQMGGFVRDAMAELGISCSDGVANDTLVAEAASLARLAASAQYEVAQTEEPDWGTFHISMPMAPLLTQVCDSWHVAVEAVTTSAPCTVGVEADVCESDEEVSRGATLVQFSSLCNFQQCRNTLPDWLGESEDERLDLDWFCNCMPCRPFWMQNFCSTMTIGVATLTRMRESDMFGYNSLSWLMIVILSLIAVAPGVTIFVHLFWWFWIGQPWSVPADAELEGEIVALAEQIQEELTLHGTIQSTWWERVSLRWEFWQYILDFGSDVFLIVQYLQHYHYIFAGVQGFIVLLTAREELWTLGLRRLYRALNESLRYGLRTDDFLRLGQSERIIEGPLSLMLLVYTSFYMSTDTFAYITSLFSLLMSTSSVAKGCYYHIDLALDVFTPTTPVKLPLEGVASCQEHDGLTLDQEEAHADAVALGKAVISL